MPLKLYEEETTSVVVFGLLLTIDLSNPTNLFNRVLFPTFVLPNNPKEKSYFFMLFSLISYFNKKFRKSLMPILCEQEIKKIFSIPRLSIFLSCLKLSSLFIITNISLLNFINSFINYLSIK